MRTVEEWLGKDNVLGINIWKNKYQFENETFEEWLDRVSDGNEDIKDMILNKRFLFGGRILANRGLDKLGKKVTYSNCYVLSVDDSIESIYKACSDLARTFSYGGGVGIDISKLRPVNSYVNNTARKTSGACSFMDTFSQVTETIGQNGRRGALMLSMDCTHPEIIDFINIKTDLNRVTKANISVRITDDFMKAVKNDEDWELYFKTEHEEIKKIVKAKDIFKLLCKNNWDYAEPGILFWDRIKNYNILSEDENFEYAGVNPCLVGDTLIQTIEGAKPIKDLVGTQPYVYCMDNNGKLIIKKASKVWKTRENAQLVEIDFNRGKLICTPDHLIYTRNRGWVKAIELQPKDKLNGLGFSKGNEIDEMIKLTSDNKYYKHHRFIMEQMGHDIKGKDVHHLDENHLNNVYSNLQVLTHSEHSKLTNVGHICYCERDINNGQFISKQEKQNRTKTDKVNYEVKGKNFIVKSVTVLDYTEDVYDMTIPEVHNFIANNIVVHNCAEEPLPDGGSCLLGALNLSAYVENKEFNFDLFKEDICKAVKGLNEVLDQGLPLHPLAIQRETVRDYRQIGLGVMGIADMLIKMEIKYDTDEALKLCDTIGYTLTNTALKSSALLAKEYGAYPKYDKHSILSSDFVLQNAESDTYELIIKYGLRNSQLLTIAPTGSISTMIEVSGGIEPIFSFSYTRKTESLHGEDKYYKVYTKIVKEYMEENNLKEEEELPDFFVNAQTIDPFKRVEMQGIWQTSIDASISSTINLPNEATVEDVEKLYMYAWETGCKGLTIYRDGCARSGVLTLDNKKEEEEEVKELRRGEWKSLADDTYYVKRKLVIGCGTLKLFIGYSPSEQTIQDLYIVKSGQGGCEKNLQAIAIAMSALLRVGGNLGQLEKAFSGITPCPSFVSNRAKGIKLSTGNYCGMAIINEVKAFLKEINSQELPKVKNEEVIIKEEEKTEGVECPECHQKTLTMTGGCSVCNNCGYSKCN